MVQTVGIQLRELVVVAPALVVPAPVVVAMALAPVLEQVLAPVLAPALALATEARGIALAARSREGEVFATLFIGGAELALGRNDAAEAALERQLDLAPREVGALLLKDEGKALIDAVRFANAGAGLSTTRIGTAPAMAQRAEILTFFGWTAPAGLVSRV